MRRIAALFSVFLVGIAITGVLGVLARDRPPSSASIEDPETLAEHRLVQGTPCVATDVQFILLPDPPLDEEADRELLETARDVIERRANRHGNPLSPIYLPENGSYVVVELRIFGGESELPQVRRILTTEGHLEIIDPLEMTLQPGQTVITEGQDLAAENQDVGTPQSTTPTQPEPDATQALGPFPTLIDDRDLANPYISEVDDEVYVVVEVRQEAADRLVEFTRRGLPGPVVVQDNTVIDAVPDVREDGIWLAISMPSLDAAKALTTFLVSGPLPTAMRISLEEQLDC